VSELLLKPAGELAQMVRVGEVSSVELVEASLARIEALQPELNAFVHLDPEGALASAAEVGPGDERPFAGVPIAIKDTAPMAGMPFRLGSELFGDFVPRHDAFLVRRIREAGFVIVGKTNLPEFGILPVSEPRRFGPVRNPWDPERTPGGSSGGAAAAVAAGMVPLAHGSDGGGSIRIPAACCGLVGLKAARGRISRGPDLGDDLLTTDGVLTRTVAETAEMLDLLAGYEIGDATWAPPPAEPFAEAARRDPGRLRIGVTVEPPMDAPLDPQAERAVRDAAELLESLGHEVRDVPAPWAGLDLAGAFTLAFGSALSMAIARAGMIRGGEPERELVEPLSWLIWEGSRERSATELMLARAAMGRGARKVIAAWETFDVLLTPALAQRPVRIGEIDSCSANPADDFRRSGHFTPFTAIFNMTGQPAISVPLFHGDDGLPLAIQLAGAPIREDVLLSLAAQLEQARPWADRLAPPAAEAGAAASA
jgi:amidase